MTRILFILLFLPITLWSQDITITGIVTDGNKPIELANIYIEETLEGTTSDANGKFILTTKLKGEVVLVFSYLGFETLQKTILIEDKNINIEIILKEGNSLNEVVISAGTFEAREKKTTTVLRPLDIVQNPAAGADIFSALQTLPGVSTVGDQTGLFVRGGEATETQTFIDGALVTNPFFSSVPEIPARGRFNPFLFQGTVFNTGGYSAEYGQALSSVILLDTKDLPKKNILTFDLNLAGLGGSITRKLSEKTSISGNLNYTNLTPLIEIVPQNREWQTAPNNLQGILFLKHKNNSDGVFKNYLQYQKGSIGLSLPNATNNDMDNQNVENENQNFFFNNSFEGYIDNNWKTRAVAAFSYDEDKTKLGQDNFRSEEFLAQSRLTLRKSISSGFRIKTGGELYFSEGTYSFNNLSSNVQNVLSALYVESDIKISKSINGRVGLRGEYSSLLDSWNLVPRISLSKKFSKSSSVSLAYGTFRQVPESEILREQTENLNFEGSQHLILNYQLKSDGCVFRIEGYLKDYTSLVRELPDSIFDNSGFGFARGIDVFWKDEKTIPSLSYWISYSFLDSKRLYRDFPIEATPTFAANHTGNFIANYKFGNRLTLGASYTYSSGRPYLNPNNPIFLEDITPEYHNINLNASLLSNLFGDLTVFYASLRNPFSFEQVFSYRYSDNGEFRTAVDPSSDRSFFLGMVININ